MERCFHVYILTNIFRSVLYVGMSGLMPKRFDQHQDAVVAGFTKKYRLNRLVYLESCPDAMTAIVREKQIKGWRRSKKEALIASINPEWEDLGGSIYL